MEMSLQDLRKPLKAYYDELLAEVSSVPSFSSWWSARPSTICYVSTSESIVLVRAHFSISTLLREVMRMAPSPPLLPSLPLPILLPRPRLLNLLLRRKRTCPLVNPPRQEKGTEDRASLGRTTVAAN